jgi:hypothetical protein
METLIGIVMLCVVAVFIYIGLDATSNKDKN